MKTDPDEVLNRLVVAALTVFIGLIILLGALVVRQLWLQQRIADLSGELQANLEDLEEITEEAEQDLVDWQTTGASPDSAELAEVSETMQDVDRQLDVIEEGLDEIEMVLESGDPDGPAPPGDVGQDVAPDQVDELFTVFAALVGLASIAIALLLGAVASRS